jgi:hypothetical protein
MPPVRVPREPGEIEPDQDGTATRVDFMEGIGPHEYCATFPPPVLQPPNQQRPAHCHDHLDTVMAVRRSGDAWPQMIIAAGQVAIPPGGGGMREFWHHAGPLAIEIASSFKGRLGDVARASGRSACGQDCGRCGRPVLGDEVGATFSARGESGDRRPDPARVLGHHRYSARVPGCVSSV